eukprot:13205429-Alexandrium_andersonii.AAC.1
MPGYLASPYPPHAPSAPRCDSQPQLSHCTRCHSPTTWPLTQMLQAVRREGRQRQFARPESSDAGTLVKDARPNAG